MATGVKFHMVELKQVYYQININEVNKVNKNKIILKLLLKTVLLQ